MMVVYTGLASARYDLGLVGGQPLVSEVRVYVEQTHASRLAFGAEVSKPPCGVGVNLWSCRR